MEVSINALLAAGVFKMFNTFQVSARQFLALLRVWATLPRPLETQPKIPPVLLAVLLGALPEALQIRQMTRLVVRNKPGTTLLGCNL